MAWRRRRVGRPRKGGRRHPCGQLVREAPPPPPAEVLARRAAFGREIGETDWVIDQWWAAGELDDRARQAAHKFNALVRARLARIGAPRAAAMAFHDARGPSVFGAISTEQEQSAMLRAILGALQSLDGAGKAKRAVEDAVVYNRAAPLALVRVGLAAAAAVIARGPGVVR
jgi:hypothetical protein